MISFPVMRRKQSGFWNDHTKSLSSCWKDGHFRKANSVDSWSHCLWFSVVCFLLPLVFCNFYYRIVFTHLIIFFHRYSSFETSMNGISFLMSLVSVVLVVAKFFCKLVCTLLLWPFCLLYLRVSKEDIKGLHYVGSDLQSRIFDFFLL